MNDRVRRIVLWFYPGGSDDIHSGRWRALTIWIIAFTCLTAYALYNQREQAQSTDRRFCDVTQSFISSEIDLRDQLNKNDVQTVGFRQTVQETARNASYIFILAPTSPVFTEAARSAILEFFQSIDDLNASQVRLGQAALSKADEFVGRLKELRRRLKCSS